MSRIEKALAIVCLLLANGFAWFFPHGCVRMQASFEPGRIPLAANTFRGADVPVPASIPRLLGATQVLNRRYRALDGAGGPDLELFVAFYATQNLGREPHEPEVCLLGGGWKSTGRRTISLPVRDPVSGEAIAATEHRAEQGGWSLAVLSLQIGPRATFPSPARSKVSRLVESVLLLRTDGCFVRLLAKRRGAPVEGDAALYDFAREILPSVYAAYAGR